MLMPQLRLPGLAMVSSRTSPTSRRRPLPGVTVTATNTGPPQGRNGVRRGRQLHVPEPAAGHVQRDRRARGVQGTRRTASPSPPATVRVDLALDLGTLPRRSTSLPRRTLLQTEKADLNTEISSKAVTNLPLNQYRNYQTLLNLVPGATPTQFQNAEIDTPGRSLRTWVNGTQPNANTTRVDGAVSINVWLPHHARYIQSAESIDTVNVATNTFDADTGMAAGAAQTVITKSGTNQLRGSAFYFFNSDSSTRTRSSTMHSASEAAVDQKTFGGTVGGPIVKNKLFFFGSYERFHEQAPDDVHLQRPDGADARRRLQRSGGGVPDLQAFNPFTGPEPAREQWTNNAIPSNLLSPIALTS